MNLDKNNNIPNEKSTKTDDSSGEEKIKRKVQVQTPLNLSEKFKSSNCLSNKLMNKFTLSLSLMNYITNKPNATNNICKFLKESKESRNGIRNDEMKKAIYYRDYNVKKERNNYLNKKSLTENNFNYLLKDVKNSENNLYTRNPDNAKHNENNNNKIVKNKSFDCLKRFSLNSIEKIIDSKYKKINESNKENNAICHYIKVNKKKIDNDNIENINNNIRNETINVDYKRSQVTNDIINKYKNYLNKEITRNLISNNKINNKTSTNNKAYNTEFLNKKTKKKITAFKKIEKACKKNNNHISTNNKSEQIKRKTMNIFEKNKLEHNIFLDKTYQNRFKKKTKNQNKPQNDIFTSDKQKEYNNFIVKKKSNYLTNQIINSNNNSNSNNEINNKDWVYRLYNKEIKKQKIKDKIILLLRKSILNEKKNKKQKLAKSKTVKQLKNYKYPINEGYNIDDNFNIINLFLSEDKKKRKKHSLSKKKKIKRCQSFNTYRNKKNKRNSFDSNKIADEKIGKLIEEKICLKNHRSYKKFRLLYNEELIDEEDEEKEKDEDEEEQ